MGVLSRRNTAPEAPGVWPLFRAEAETEPHGVGGARYSRKSLPRLARVQPPVPGAPRIQRLPADPPSSGLRFPPAPVPGGVFLGLYAERAEAESRVAGAEGLETLLSGPHLTNAARFPAPAPMSAPILPSPTFTREVGRLRCPPLPRRGAPGSPGPSASW